MTDQFSVEITLLTLTAHLMHPALWSRYSVTTNTFAGAPFRSLIDEAGFYRYGLYDMLGKVWEWTASEYDAISKTLRGGSWNNNPQFTRASNFLGREPGKRLYNFGFRCLGD